MTDQGGDGDGQYPTPAKMLLGGGKRKKKVWARERFFRHGRVKKERRSKGIFVASAARKREKGRRWCLKGGGKCGAFVKLRERRKRGKGGLSFTSQEG